MTTRSQLGLKIYHGGCLRCLQPEIVCRGCCYMNANWELPDLNSKIVNKIRTVLHNRNGANSTNREKDEIFT